MQLLSALVAEIFSVELYSVASVDGDNEVQAARPYEITSGRETQSGSSYRSMIPVLLTLIAQECSTVQVLADCSWVTAAGVGTNTAVVTNTAG